jgi:curved DNA-binding protein CbpA
VLDLPFTATEGDVKRTYRKKSLLIHPDKFKHERGVEVRPGSLARPAERQPSFAMC